MLVGGEWVDARSGETFETVDPYTARPWATLPRAGPEDVDAAVAAARRAFDDGPWRTRARPRARAAAAPARRRWSTERALEIATIEVTDNGKLLREMERPAARAAGLPALLRRAPRTRSSGETIPGRRARTA